MTTFALLLFAGLAILPIGMMVWAIRNMSIDVLILAAVLAIVITVCLVTFALTLGAYR